jgi:hypothetical protein
MDDGRVSQGQGVKARAKAKAKKEKKKEGRNEKSGGIVSWKRESHHVKRPWLID